MNDMTKEKLYQIFEETNSKWDGDNAFQGLMILSKYTKDLIEGADHEVIWSADIDVILSAGLTEADAKSLALLNWHLDEDGDCFSCFV